MAPPTLAILAALLAGQAQTAAAPPSFCARLAPDLGMTPINPTIVDGARANDGWRLNLLKGLGPALFGGTATVGFSVQPVGDWNEAEFERLNKVCNPNGKGVLCTVEGPARFGVKTKRGEVKLDALPGERATVEMRGTSVFCRDLPAG